MCRASSVMALAATVIVIASNVFGQDQTMGVVVHVHTDGTMPGDVLHDAEARATQIFGAIGIPLHWANDECECRRAERPHMRHIYMGVLSSEGDERFATANHVSAQTLGLAATAANRVYLFAARLRELAAPSYQAWSVVLGRAMAHEIGHILLPGTGHSDRGIMRAVLDNGGTEDPGFTPSERDSILAVLAYGRIPGGAGEPSRSAALEAD
jgi:hypothetical protein